MDVWVIVWCVIYGIATLICFPILLYHLIQFWQSRNMDFIQKRRPVLVFIVTIMFMAHLIGMNRYCRFIMFLNRNRLCYLFAI